MFPTRMFAAVYFAPRYWERPSAVVVTTGHAPKVGGLDIADFYAQYEAMTRAAPTDKKTLRKKETEFAIALLLLET